MATPEDVGHGRLGLLASTIVGASAADDARQVIHATFHNNHSISVAVNVYYMRSGETTSNDGVLKARKTIPPGKTWVCLPLIGQPIRKNGFIQALASIDNVIDYNIGVNVG